MVTFGRFNRGSEGVSEQTEEQKQADQAAVAQKQQQEAQQAAQQAAQLAAITERYNRGSEGITPYTEEQKQADQVAIAQKQQQKAQQAAQLAAITERYNRGSEGITPYTEAQKAADAASVAQKQQEQAQTVQLSTLTERFDRSQTTIPVGTKAGDIVVVNGKQYYYKGPKYTYDISDIIKQIQEQAEQQGATVKPTAQMTDVTYEKSGGIVRRVETPQAQTADTQYKKSGGIVLRIDNPYEYTGQTVFNSKEEAQAAIDAYLGKFNFSQYDISDAVSSIWGQANDYGAGSYVKKYSGITIFGSESDAQAAIDLYLGEANTGLNTWYDAQPITIFDSLGREQKVTKSQYNQMVEAQKTATKYQNYSVLPEEVANSNANWWINSKGLYEWTPVTSSDIKALEKLNNKMTKLGWSVQTTLTAGAVWSDWFESEWYSTGGNRVQAPIGSGDLKIQAIKSSSSINNSSSAKTGTAQSQKATVKNTNDYLQELHPGQIQLSDGSWINQVENVGGLSGKGEDSLRIFSSNEEYKITIENEKAAIKKQQEEGKKAYDTYMQNLDPMMKGIEITNLSQESTAGIQGIISGEGYLSRSTVVEQTKQEIQEQRKAEKEAAKQASQQIGLEKLTDWVNENGVKELTKNEIKETIAGTTGAIAGLAGIGVLDEKTTIEINTSIKEAAATGKTTVKDDALVYKLSDFAVDALDKGNKELSEALSPIFEDAESIKAKYDETLSGIDISLNEKGKVYITKKGNAPEETFLTINAKTAKDQYVEVNPIVKGIDDFLDEEYNEIKEKPLSKALEYGSYYLGGVAFGAAIKGAKVLSSPIGKAAGKKVAEQSVKLIESTSKPFLKEVIGKTGSFAAGSLETGAVIDQVMMIGLGKEGIETLIEGYTEGGAAGATKNVLKFSEALAIGVPGYKKGDLIAGRVAEGDLIAAVPIVKTAKISEMSGSGSNTTPIDLSYGYTIAPLNKPVVTYVKGEGFKLGSAGAPKNIIEGKTTQAFSKLETKFFEETVKDTADQNESEYLSSLLNILKGVSDTNKVPTMPETFEITSKSIPEAMRAAVKEGIISYKGNIMVAGSVPMKAQSDPFVSRTPHDLELYGDSETAIVSHISKVLESKGFKEGVDFKNTGSKIDFKIKDEETGNEIFDTGIEAFTHGHEKTESEQIIENALLKLKQVSESVKDSESPSPKTKSDKSDIAFGYKSQEPVSLEEGKIKIQSLKEQMYRKGAGSSFYKEGTLQPTHTGRIKDPLDVITMSTAFAVKNKVPIDKDIINFTNSAYKKWGVDAPNQNKMSKAFQEKVTTDPVVDFIYKNQRLPTEAELKGMGKELPEITQTEILFSNIKGNKKNELMNEIVSGDSYNSKQIKSEFGTRSPSPIPGIKQGSPSIPGIKQGSPSIPGIKQGSPSIPGIKQGSPSPSIPGIKQGSRGSPSPSPFQESRGSPSPSPFQESRGSPSPLPFQGNRGSPSPLPFQGNRGSPSPLPFQGNRGSPSPLPFPESPSSPSPYIPSPSSPSPSSPSPSSPSPYIPSPSSPSPHKNKDDDVIILPDWGFQGLRSRNKQNNVWKASMKHHYVLDPFSFVFGKKRGR